ncbi:LysM peptidoglycan-binding domain-containing protein [Enterococcus rivorum]|uniref:LysM domain-containing protein n=1 Tax=Enterococcus rivorum TaxID=762845 RepID=A0A1E5KXJ0_9ENTE|nr:LysM peptidoglycan-binding domain-containing protein [Enterococcus rivorum]MBP2099478.1 LysM repeat protein [Enterococcus rivorum]OEH82592.1 hypothetical protein BCR26_12675 [Enterococcus rivorum]
MENKNSTRRDRYQKDIAVMKKSKARQYLLIVLGNSLAYLGIFLVLLFFYENMKIHNHKIAEFEEKLNNFSLTNFSNQENPSVAEQNKEPIIDEKDRQNQETSHVNSQESAPLVESALEDNNHPESSSTQQEVAHYVVKEGDSLSRIAEQNNLSLTTLMQMNNLNDHTILPGISLRVK